MSSKINKVIVVGAGGNLGPAVVNALISSPHSYTVSTLSREQSSYSAPAGVRSVKTDYSHASLVNALEGQDAIVATISNAALLDQIKIIDAAIEAGVKRFIPAEFGADSTNLKALKLAGPFLQPKKTVLEYLQAKKDKLEWTILLTGPFFDWALEHGFLGLHFDTSRTSFDPKYKSSAFSTSTRSLIGQAVSQALSPSIAPKTANQVLYVRSFTVSQESLLVIVEKGSGKKWPNTAVDLDALVEEAKEKLKKGDFSGMASIVGKTIFDPETGNDFDKRGVVSNQLLELPAEDIEAVVRSILAT